MTSKTKESPLVVAEPLRQLPVALRTPAGLPEPQFLGSEVVRMSKAGGHRGWRGLGEGGFLGYGIVHVQHNPTIL